jgi:DNA repair protein RecO (recombination protein O)
MLVKSRAIVLHTLPYSENSLIVTLFTEQFGRISCLVNAARGGKTGNKSSVLQPLFILETELYQKKSRELQRMKELRLLFPYQSIPFQVVKSAQVLFLAEFLNRLIREEEPNPGIYTFLENAFLFLDNMTTGTANFHLWFLVRFTEWAGICPLMEKEAAGWFDMKRGTFTPDEPLHPFYMSRETTSLFREISRTNINEMCNLVISHPLRSTLTVKLMEFYHLHFENLGNFKSLAVLQEVFRP